MKDAQSETNTWHSCTSISHVSNLFKEQKKKKIKKIGQHFNNLTLIT